MNCAQCGNNVADDSAVCPNCDTRPGNQAATVYSFDVNRWAPADRVVGGASLVLLVALFMPWFTVSSGGFGSLSTSGTGAHGWLWFAFVLALLPLAYLIVAAGYDRFPVNLPLTHDRLLRSVPRLNLLLVFLSFILKPGGSGVGWDFGAFAGLIAAIAAALPVTVTAQFQRITKRR